MKKEISIEFNLKKSKEVTFHVKSKGRKMGRLEVAEKGIKWFPANNKVNAKIEIKWEDFIERNVIIEKTTPKKKKIKTTRSKKKTPQYIMLNSERIYIKKSYEILTRVAEFLIGEGKLNRSEAPIKYSDRSKRYIINTKPVHPDGKPFHSYHQLSNKLYVDTNYSTNEFIKRAKFLLEIYGYNKNILRI